MELLPLVCLCLLSCSGDAVRVVVEEDRDAVLPCLISTKEDITGKAFEWRKDGQKVYLYDSGSADLRGQDEQFNGRVSHFQDQLKNGDASIKILNTKMADSGNFSCDFPGFELGQTSIIELLVDPVLKDRTNESTPGAAPEPCIRTLAESRDSSVLQCEAHGVPRPTIKWKDSDDNTLPAEETKISDRGGRFYVTVKITVTKNDDYSCVATQEEISHRIASVTSVSFDGPSTGAIVGYVFLGLFLLFLGGGCWGCIQGICSRRG